MNSKLAGLAERLRLAREQAGLSQAQVARQLGLHRPSVSEIEAGRRKVSADELAALSKLYGVSVAWLSGIEDEQDVDKTRVELAARQLAKMAPDDLNRVLDLLSALRREKGKNE
jgi:transcriptional regulator with XRE-family HTH domain